MPSNVFDHDGTRLIDHRPDSSMIQNHNGKGVPVAASPDEVIKALKEADYHFTLTRFEALLHEHGLEKLLADMSDESAHALLIQAAELEYGL